MLKVGIVAGEASGDTLGAAIITELTKHNPNIAFIGMGGKKMQQCNFKALYHSHQIAYVGIIDPLLNIKKLLKMRQHLVQYFLEQKIDLFIGIDAPDFNFGIEKQLKAQGVSTVHYVGPQVWAWRRGRAKKISQFIDLLLLLFPFEQQYYQNFPIKTAYVGHPLITQIPLKVNKQPPKQLQPLPKKTIVLAVLVGSRTSEIKHLLPTYLQAIKQLTAMYSLQIVMPLARKTHKELAQQLMQQAKVATQIHISVGNIDAVLATADLALVTSGTATLEVMLYKVPMLICYKVNWLMYALLRPFIKPPFMGLPNLIAQQQLVPELLQSEVTVAKIVTELQKYIENTELRQQVSEQFQQLHQKLRVDSNQRIAQLLLDNFLS